MKIADILRPEDVILDLRAADKPRLVEELARRSAELAGIGASAIADVLNARERLGSTGMGAGIAIPHARLASLTRPVGLFARLRHADRLRRHRWPAGRSRLPAAPAGAGPGRSPQRPRLRGAQAQGRPSEGGTTQGARERPDLRHSDTSDRGLSVRLIPRARPSRPRRISDAHPRSRPFSQGVGSRRVRDP